MIQKAPTKQNLKNLLQYYQERKFDDAEQLALSIVKEFPNNQFSLKILGGILVNKGRFLEAINIYKKSAKLNPGDPQTYYNLGISFKNCGKFLESESSYRQAIFLNPNYVEAYNNLANIQKKLNKMQEAEINYKRAIELNSNFAEPYYNLGTLYQKTNKTLEAEANFKIAIKLKPNYAEAHNNLGSLFQELEKLEEAEFCFRKSVSLNPNLMDAYLNLFELLEKLNRINEGFKIINNLEDTMGLKSPDLFLFKAIFLYRLKKFEDFESVINEIKIHDISTHRKPTFLNLKANWLNDKKEFDEAFKNFKNMNKLIKETKEFKRCKPNNFYNGIKNKILFIKKNELDKTKEISFKSKWQQPVFLIGFPRSGTTLLDTVLRSHSEISVVEEKSMLEKVVKSLNNKDDIEDIENIKCEEIEKLVRIYFDEFEKQSGGEMKKILIDKLPLNILNIPLINHIFPNAKFIFALRHPSDCILSCWMQNFKLNDAMANFCDLKQAVDFYCTTMEFYELCKKRYNLTIQKIHYEELVNDFEKQVINILSFLKLEWQNNIRNFQKTASKRTIIKTPSYFQVIKPIYKTSTYRWKNYEQYLNKYN